jgi:hypothetical protein
MRLTLSAYEKRTLNSSGGIFTVLSINGSIELSSKGLEDIPLETGDQISIGDRPKISLQNISSADVVIDFIITSATVDKKAQVTRTEIINTSPIEVHFDEAFTIGAVAQQGQWNIGVLSAQINTHKPRVECIAGQATKLFGAGTRKSNRINIRSEQLNGVSLGGDSTVNDESGGYLDVGMVDYMDTSGELWAFNNGGSSIFVDVLELI